MSNSKLAPEEIRNRLVATAKDLFLQKGIANTEMKEIASLSDISRSTLYRYVIDRNQLAFMVGTQIFTELTEKSFDQTISHTATGYEKLQHFIYHHIEILCENINIVNYMNEFDCLFRGDYPDIPEAKEYSATINRMLNRIAQFMFEGLSDGSIRQIDDPLFFISVLLNCIFGLGERVLPRDAHYIEEHHASAKAMLLRTADILLSSIRP